MLVMLLSLFISNLSFAGDIPWTPPCAQFDHVVRFESGDDKSGFQMDQIVIHRNGKTMYAWADGAYKLDSLHSLWSGSKTVVATLVGAAIQQGRLSL
jgi:CubicO group peptidase (beta-lactamase class C family)